MPSDVAPLAQLQRELLASALSLVRPGGVVAYATCSPHPRETTQVIERMLASPSCGVEQIDVRPLMPSGMALLGEGPSVQLWPHRHGTDAMFIALLRRAD